MSDIGRPKMKEAKKRVQLSVSLAPNVAQLAEKTENKSKFLDNSVMSIQAVAMVIAKFRKKDMSLEEAMIELEDLVDVWESEFDETEDFVFSE